MSAPRSALRTLIAAALHETAEASVTLADCRRLADTVLGLGVVTEHRPAGHRPIGVACADNRCGDRRLLVLTVPATSDPRSLHA